MALSLAQRTQQRKRAAAAAASTPAHETMAGHSTYELHMAQLHQHYQQLKGLQSTEQKAALKAELLPVYAGYIAGVLAEGQGAQDDVLTTTMVWHLDAMQVEHALDIAEYVLKHGLKLPDRFARDAATLVTEEIAEQALRGINAGEAFPTALLLRTAELTAGRDMPDEVRAKLNVALGRSYMHGIDPKADTYTSEALAAIASAVSHYQRALTLHDKCGCKRNKEDAERLLKKHAGTTG